MTQRIGSKHFSGDANLHNGVLADAIRQMAISDARTKLAAAVTATSIAVLTDNSAGAAADGTVGLIPIPAAFTEVGTASAQKAGFETALGTVKNALTELAAKLVAAKAFVPATDVTNAVGGTAADGTIAAVGVALTGVNTSIAAYAGSKTVCENIRNYFHTLVYETNKLAVAVGVTKLVNSVGGDPINPPTLGALSIDTGTAVDGTALSGISEVGGEAFLTACAAATKEIATKINAILAVTTQTVANVVAAD